VYLRLRATRVADGDPQAPPGLLVVIEDQTRAQHLAQQLRQSEERYQTLMELSPDGIVIHDVGRIVYANPAAIRLMGGRQAEDLVGRSVLDFVHPDYRELVVERQRVLAESAESADLVEERFIRLDGQEIDVEVVAHSVTYNGRRAVKVLAHDVTARKRAESGLRASHERFRLLTENVRDYAIMMLDPAGYIVSWNSGAERMTGFRADEAIRQHVGKLFPEEDVDADRPGGMLEQAVRNGRCQEEGWRIRRDGSRFWASVAVTALLDPSQQIVGFAKIVRDLTERRDAEEALRRSEDHLRQAQKMEAIGRLAGGIAHDFNNLLTAIQGHAQFLIEDLNDDSTTQSDAIEIKRAADRAAALTRQLLAFSRRQVLQPQVLDVNRVIRDIQSLLRRVIREDIALVTSLEDGLWDVYADAGQVEQVLMNLVVNARDAMPDGGSLTVQTVNVALDTHYVMRGSSVPPGEYVQICVTDTGVGMDRETQTKIFEPFFTTKAEGEGTGLGLATVYGIVRQSLGHISVYSELGRGTTFKVFLPRVGESERAVSEVAPNETARGKESILVAEDDPTVRAIVTRVLEERGYSVVEADSGEEALALASDYDGPIDLLVTDVVLAGMNGRKLAEGVRATHPAAQVLFMSGFTAQDVVRQGLVGASDPFLEKPFSADKLAHRVRQILDGTV
jgi:PAS domain S-box-containing protein